MGLIDFNYSYSAAISLLKNVIGLMMVLLVNFITKKLNQSGIW